jgi:hypothetical protein
VAVAWIGFAGGVFAALLSALVAVRQSRMDERLLRLGHELDAEQQRRAALFDRDLEAEEVLTRYRQPLAAAAYDLQGRLYNIVVLGFVEGFGGDHPRSEEAARTTLFRIAQYFGWSEILRRDVQFLSFADDGESRAVARLQARISEHFLDSGPGPALMLWRDEQRAIGERMIVEEHGKVLCMGYARFSECCETAFAPWLERLWAEISEPAAQARMRAVQHSLCELAQMLDARGVLYADELERA